MGIRGDTDYLEPCLLQLPEGFPHRGMLHSGGDDPGLVLPICPGNSTDGKIVAFRCPGGEVDAARFTGKDGSQGTAHPVYSQLGLQTCVMQGGWIPVIFCQALVDGPDRRLAGLGGCCVVQINSHDASGRISDRLLSCSVSISLYSIAHFRGKCKEKPGFTCLKNFLSFFKKGLTFGETRAII